MFRNLGFHVICNSIPVFSRLWYGLFSEKIKEEKSVYDVYLPSFFTVKFSQKCNEFTFYLLEIQQCSTRLFVQVNCHKIVAD